MSSCINVCMKSKANPSGDMGFWENLWWHLTRPGAEGGGMY